MVSDRQAQHPVLPSPRARHNGEYSRVSGSANRVPQTRLKQPMWRKSPISRAKNATAIPHLPHDVRRSGSNKPSCCGEAPEAQPRTAGSHHRSNEDSRLRQRTAFALGHGPGQCPSCAKNPIHMECTEGREGGDYAQRSNSHSQARQSRCETVTSVLLCQDSRSAQHSLQYARISWQLAMSLAPNHTQEHHRCIDIVCASTLHDATPLSFARGAARIAVDGVRPASRWMRHFRFALPIFCTSDSCIDAHHCCEE